MSGTKVIAGSDVPMPLPMAAVAAAGGPTDVSVAFGTIALAGFTTMNVTVPGVKLGDLVFLTQKPGESLIAVNARPAPIAEGVSDDTVRVTISSSGVSVALGTRIMRFWWLRWV